VWSEYPNGKGAINFITGMGGFLQSLLFGFLGIRLEPTCLTIKPVLHSHWTRIRLTGKLRCSTYLEDVSNAYR